MSEVVARNMDGVETVLLTVVPDVFPDVRVLRKVALPPPLHRLAPVLLRLVLLPALMVAAERNLVVLLAPVRLLELVVVSMGGAAPQMPTVFPPMDVKVGALAPAPRQLAPPLLLLRRQPLLRQLLALANRF